MHVSYALFSTSCRESPMGIAIILFGLFIRFFALVKAILLLKNRPNWRAYVLTAFIAFSFLHIPISTQFSPAEWIDIPWQYLATFLGYSFLGLIAVQYTSYYLEISDSKQQALKQFMAVFDQFMRSAPLGCFIIQDGNVVFANEAACSMTGYPEDEINELPFIKLAPPGKEDQLNALITFKGRLNTSNQSQIQIQTKNKSLIWGQATFGAVEFRGRPAIAGTIQDITDHVASQSSLSETEKRLRLATEIAGIQVWEWDVSNQGVKHESDTSNLACRQIEDFKHFQTLLHPDHKDQVMKAIRHTLNGEDQYDQEFLLRTPDGTYRWQHSIGKVVMDESGSPSHMIGAAIDITERHQKEELIQFHADLLARIDEAIVAQNLKGEVIYYNKAAERIIGKPEGDDFTQSLNLKIPQEHRVINNPRIMGRLRAGQSWSGSYTIYNFNGDAIPTHLTVSPIRDGLGRFNGFIGVATDMTAYREIQQKLEMNQERLLMAMEAAKIVVWDLDLDSNTVYREVPETMQAYPEGALRTTDTLKELLHPEEVKWISKKVRSSLKNQSGFSLEHRFRHPDGTYQWWHTQAKPIESSAADLRRIIGASQLITERKIAETQIQQQFHQLQAIYNVVDTVTQADDLHSICQAASASLKLALGACSFGIVSFNDAHEDAHFIFADHIPAEIQTLVITHCNPVPGQPAEPPAIFEDLTKLPPSEYRPDLLLQHDIYAISFSPLSSQEKVLGKMVVCYPAPLEKSDDHLELTKRIADHIALAIINHLDQQALRESEAQNKAILKALPDMVFKVDHNGVYLEVVQAPDRKVLFKSPEDIIGFKLQDIMPLPLANHALAKIKTTLETNEAQVLEYPAEIGSSRKYYEARFAKCADNQVLIIVRDITERRTLQQTIADTSARQQRRIGQDLHDQLGQLLTGIGFRIAGLKQQLLTKCELDARDASEINEMVEQAIAQTRLLAEGLNPITLDVHGLRAGLERLALNTAKLYGLKCTFHYDLPDCQFDEEVAVQVYRIAQEAVNNAIKHAKSDRISITLSKAGEKKELCIEDNGVGIQLDNKRHEGHGLPIMNYRASMIDATIDIAPIASGGTRVTCLFDGKSSWHTKTMLPYPHISQGPPINN